jgi:hypothetical protein
MTADAAWVDDAETELMREWIRQGALPQRAAACLVAHVLASRWVATAKRRAS